MCWNPPGCISFVHSGVHPGGCAEQRAGVLAVCTDVGLLRPLTIRLPPHGRDKYSTAPALLQHSSFPSIHREQTSRPALYAIGQIRCHLTKRFHPSLSSTRINPLPKCGPKCCSRRSECGAGYVRRKSRNRKLAPTFTGYNERDRYSRLER